MAVVCSKVLLIEPPLIYTAPDTCVFGAVLEEEFENSKGDPKKVWKYIYSIIQNSKLEENKDEIHLKTDKKEKINNNDTSEYINNFFINIGPKLAEKYKENWKYFDKEVETNIDTIEID